MRLRENRLFASDLCRDRESSVIDLFGQHYGDELFSATTENLHQVRWACACML